MSFSPKQVEVLVADEREICVDGGRRFGKSFIAAAKVTMLVHERVEDYRRRIRSGEVHPWAGEGLPAAKARHVPPNIECWVVAPRERHLEQCRSYLQSYYGGLYYRFLHPELGLCDSGRQMWIYYGGVAARVRFVVGQSAVGMVSGALDILWIDEAGLVDNGVVHALDPVLWERDARIVKSGTPELGTDHHFTRACLAGLDESHPYYVPDVVPRDPTVKTVIGTSFDAYLPAVREAARRDEKRNGEAWARQWLHGDWRLPSLFVYPEWDAAIHGIEYHPGSRMIRGRRLPPPTATIGIKDWHYAGDKPGAVVVFDVWHRNPLDVTDLVRPLVVAREDHQGSHAYTKDGWFDIMADLRRRTGLHVWYADPSAPDMIRHAQHFTRDTGPIRPAEKGDKAGRINLVRALLHYDDTTPPAFYVAAGKCKNLMRQFETYRMAMKKSGEVTDSTIDYDDHALDCCAFLVGKVMRGGYSVPDLSARI